MKSNSTIEMKFWGICMIIAPLIGSISVFFWENGEYGVNGGLLTIISSVFWIPAFMGLFGMLKNKMPYYANMGLFIAIYGCVSGALFGFTDIYDAIFHISHDESLQAFTQYPLHLSMSLYWAGPLFPLSLAIVAVVLIWKREVPVWAGILLAAGALLFPVSRIPRLELVAHATNLLLLIPLVCIGWTLWNKKRLPGTE
ncbi:hypothetical protein [Lihuaxuella thermophila]|uniref:Uncharacterized protein n=1 Tax=Lihuaxuella thermophila TaxID=1173111 RepID=A0A1H8J4Z6_9BACL|nr:hypothetical protein [Lihuaxuella thermophila]SEN75525.1 hypothetical protein SAMN05444955_12148 [Lihuaxuella thermophila]